MGIIFDKIMWEAEASQVWEQKQKQKRVRERQEKWNHLKATCTSEITQELLNKYRPS